MRRLQQIESENLDKLERKKQTQDREADVASARKRRAALAEDEKAHDRETNTAARRRKRESRAEDEKAQDRAINAAFQRDKRGSSYANHSNDCTYCA